VDLEAGEGLGGGAGDLGDQAAATVVVVDPPGGVRGFDGQCPSSVDDADVDALFGNDQCAAAGDASLHAQRLGRGRGWWPGGAGVAQPGLFGGGERVGQRPQQAALVDQLQQAAVEADGEAAAGEVAADRVAPAGQPERSTPPG
jgi:hypothetical protein